MGFTTAFEGEIAKHIYQNTDVALIGDATGLRGSTTTGSIYVQLHTVYPAEASGAQNSSEAGYTGYARQALTRNSTNFPESSGALSNGVDITFPVGGVGTTPETLIAWSTGASSSGAGKIINRGPLCSAIYAFTATTADVITAPGHAIAANEPVMFVAGKRGGSLPTGLTEGSIFYAKTISGDTFKVSATPGGADIDLTSAGSGFVARMQPIPMAAGITPRILAGSMSIGFD